jgi:hypothetical protein
MLARCLIAVFVFFTIASCAVPLKVNIESRRDAAYLEKIDKILIFVSLDKICPESSPVSQSFITQLSARGVITESLVIHRDDSKDVQDNALKRFEPKQLMYLIPKRIKTSTITSGNKKIGTNVSGWTLECSVYDTGTKKRIWRSSIEWISGSHCGQEIADILVEEIIEKLETDGLLPVSNTGQKKS